MKKQPSTIYELDEYDARGVEIVILAEDETSRVSIVTFAPGGLIGAHPTGMPQLFHVISGRGWMSGGDGDKVTIGAGEHVVWEAGEDHASGSHGGMTVVIVQSEDPEAFSPAAG